MKLAAIAKLIKMGRGYFARCSPAKISGFVLSIQL